MQVPDGYKQVPCDDLQPVVGYSILQQQPNGTQTIDRCDDVPDLALSVWMMLVFPAETRETYGVTWCYIQPLDTARASEDEDA